MLWKVVFVVRREINTFRKSIAKGEVKGEPWFSLKKQKKRGATPFFFEKV